MAHSTSKAIRWSAFALMAAMLAPSQLPSEDHISNQEAITADESEPPLDAMNEERAVRELEAIDRLHKFMRMTPPG